MIASLYDSLYYISPYTTTTTISIWSSGVWNALRWVPLHISTITEIHNRTHKVVDGAATTTIATTITIMSTTTIN